MFLRQNANIKCFNDSTDRGKHPVIRIGREFQLLGSAARKCIARHLLSIISLLSVRVDVGSGELNPQLTLITSIPDVISDPPRPRIGGTWSFASRPATTLLYLTRPLSDFVSRNEIRTNRIAVLQFAQHYKGQLDCTIYDKTPPYLWHWMDAVVASLILKIGFYFLYD